MGKKGNQVLGWVMTRPAGKGALMGSSHACRGGARARGCHWEAAGVRWGGTGKGPPSGEPVGSCRARWGPAGKGAPRGSSHACRGGARARGHRWEASGAHWAGTGKGPVRVSVGPFSQSSVVEEERGDEEEDNLGGFFLGTSRRARVSGKVFRFRA
jgi:hypothetical protein